MDDEPIRADTTSNDGHPSSVVGLYLTVTSRHPPAGEVRTTGGRVLAFAGWLGLLGAVADTLRASAVAVDDVRDLAAGADAELLQQVRDVGLDRPG